MSDSFDYLVRHVTRFRYSAAVSESALELRMQPRSDGAQQGRAFTVQTNPRAQIFHYEDGLGNIVHHFDIPDRHTQLTIQVEAAVTLRKLPALPAQVAPSAWAELDDLTADGSIWDWLQPSQFARPTPALDALARELTIKRGRDPLSTLWHLNSLLHDALDYVPQSTTVDSPIDEALGRRAGVCQDFAHIMITVGRGLGIPSRYVSGYLARDRAAHDRSAADATHAWVEAWVPSLGWVGFDPTNDLSAGERHIRVAVGRDYADVPPTRGVFRGQAETELSVAVSVGPADAPALAETTSMRTLLTPPPNLDDIVAAVAAQQQ